MEWLDTIVGFVVGGGLLSLLTIPQIIKKAKAEARAAEIDNVQAAVESWKEIANERQEEIAELKQQSDTLNGKIDNLYVEISSWRDKYNGKCEEITALQVYKATNEVKLCMKRGCPDREPHSGY